MPATQQVLVVSLDYLPNFVRPARFSCPLFENEDFDHSKNETRGRYAVRAEIQCSIQQVEQLERRGNALLSRVLQVANGDEGSERPVRSVAHWFFPSLPFLP
jgi:hypothetical protein